LPVVHELLRRGWTNKSWTTRQGQRRGGRPFTKTQVRKLLTNVTYRGQIQYQKEVHAGDHTALVDAELWQRVQMTLQRRGRTDTGRGPSGALLAGLLRCGACRCAMVASYAVKRTCRYRYYVCAQAQQRGWRSCPAPSLPAVPIEQYVVDQIKGLGQHPAWVKQALASEPEQADAAEPEARRLAAEQSLAALAGVWDSLPPLAQARLVRLLVERVVYDGVGHKVAITFYPAGLQSLAEVLAGELALLEQESNT
jgi:site-specific DNA recombinase